MSGSLAFPGSEDIHTLTHSRTFSQMPCYSAERASHGSYWLPVLHSHVSAVRDMHHTVHLQDGYHRGAVTRSQYGDGDASMPSSVLCLRLLWP